MRETCQAATPPARDRVRKRKWRCYSELGEPGEAKAGATPAPGTAGDRGVMPHARPRMLRLGLGRVILELTVERLPIEAEDLGRS